MQKKFEIFWLKCHTVREILKGDKKLVLLFSEYKPEDHNLNVVDVELKRHSHSDIPRLVGATPGPCAGLVDAKVVRGTPFWLKQKLYGRELGSPRLSLVPEWIRVLFETEPRLYIISNCPKLLSRIIGP